MTDKELIARLRSACFLAFDDGTNDYSSAPDAADRIEALMNERDEATNQLDSARHSVDVLEKRVEALVERLTAAEQDAHEAEALANEALARAERLEAAADYILDGMGIDAPDYEIDPDDDFLDAANSDWVRDVLMRLAAALKGDKT